MKLQIRAENTNYAARVIELGELRKHPNADKLQIVTVIGYNVITWLSAKEGQKYIYFPQGSALNKSYLAWSNSFSSSELNADVKKKGFFPSSARVKVVKLQGVASEGYITPASSLVNWLSSLGYSTSESDFVTGKDFDTFGDLVICEKYVNQSDQWKAFKAERKTSKKVVKVSWIVEDQFRVGEDTRDLKRNIESISPNDYISITYKLHGCHGSMGNVLCLRPLKWYEKVLKKFGCEVNNQIYDYVWASRRVIKNKRKDIVASSFYDVDIWSIMVEKYKNCLQKGITLYGEIINQLPNEKWIQKDFDYGLPAGVADFFIYRITSTNAAGNIIEFTWTQIQRYCAKFGLKTVPLFYYGKAKDWDSVISTEAHWHENFLAKLIEKYTEKDCYLCKNKVPEEGVVIAKDGAFFEAYKLKSLKFLEFESDTLDKGEVSIEDMEAPTEAEAVRSKFWFKPCSRDEKWFEKKARWSCHQIRRLLRKETAPPTKTHEERKKYDPKKSNGRSV